MAEEDALDKVLGDYGVFLVEMGPLDDLSAPCKSSTRIKYTCMSVGQKFIALGCTSGSVYLFTRRTLQCVRVISSVKGAAIQLLCFSASGTNTLGIATSTGIVLVYDVGSKARDKPKCVRRSGQHKGATVLSMCWDEEGSRLFAGDDKGYVSVIYMPFFSKVGGSSSSKRLSIHSTDIVGKSETAIQQLDCTLDRLLISTMTKTAILDLPSGQCWPVGTKPREGKFGACYFRQKNQEVTTLYTGRPSSRLWEASIDGQVLATQQYKQLLACPPSPVLGHGSESDLIGLQSGEYPPQAFNFPQLLMIRDRFLLTWHERNLYLLDPVLGQVVGWYQLHQEVQDICCRGAQLYVYHPDSHVTWYGALTVKECVARLYELNKTVQCVQVALSCQAYLIPGAARDWVPVSMISTLRQRLCDDGENQDAASRLVELENLLEEGTGSDRPPGFYGDAVIDTPDTMSVSSETWQDDEASVSSEPVALQEDEEFSFENVLIAAAARAKRFTEERNMRLKFPLLRKLSEDPKFTSPGSLSEGEGACSGEEIRSAESTLSDAPFNVSDDNDSKHEDEDSEASTRKEKIAVREKRKRKRKVVTVDIDSPISKNQQGDDGLAEELLLSDQHSHQASYSSFGNTKLKLHRALSEATVDGRVHGMAPQDINTPQGFAPAIPSMLNKAKVLLKKKLSENANEGSVLVRSTSLPLQSEGGSGSETEDDPHPDDEEQPLPDAVADLEKATLDVSGQVKDLAVLCSRTELRHILQEWVLILYGAVSTQSTSLLSLLSEDARTQLPALLHMCFDIGVYGPSETQESDASRCSDQPTTMSEVDELSTEKEDAASSSSCQPDSLPIDDCISSPGENMAPAERDVEGVSSKTAEITSNGTAAGPSDACESQNNTADNSVCTSCSRTHLFSVASPIGASLRDLSKRREKYVNEDYKRAQFIERYFTLMNVSRIRRTLRLSRGIKTTTWRALLKQISTSIIPSAVHHHLLENDVTRALHVLHDGMDEYQDTLLYHLQSAYSLKGRETIAMCAKMYPDVQPWEVMELCRNSADDGLVSGAQNFIYYIEQFLRWREDSGEARSLTLASLCNEEEILLACFHSALVSGEPSQPRHSPCGLPRSLSHTLPWKHLQHLTSVLDTVCRRPDLIDMARYIEMCWLHGFWTGFLRLCIAAKLRRLALLVIVYLGDTQLLHPSQPWGPLPGSLDEWRFLIELVCSVQLLTNDLTEDDTSADNKCSEGHSSDMCWENVAYLVLQRLGALHAIELLKEVPCRVKALPREFYHKCMVGAVIEREQSKLIHKILRKMDSYLWSQRASTITPQMNYLREEEESEKKQAKSRQPLSRSSHSVKTLEDAASSWGVNIHLADATCPVCSFLLCGHVSSGNQGILVFECGHVYHRDCIPEYACVVCFQQNLRSLGQDNVPA